MKNTLMSPLNTVAEKELKYDKYLRGMLYIFALLTLVGLSAIWMYGSLHASDEKAPLVKLELNSPTAVTNETPSLNEGALSSQELGAPASALAQPNIGASGFEPY